MKKLSVLLALLMVLTLAIGTAIGVTWGEPDSKHVNVGAMVVDDVDIGLVPWCSGTLVAPNIFLTAGHCTSDLDDYGISEVWVTFDQDAAPPSTLLDVREIVTHPQYDGKKKSNPYDVAILILEDAVDISPATLPAEGFLDDLRAENKLRNGSEGAKFTVVGYGATLEWPPPNIVYEDQRQFAISEYQTLLKAWLRLSQNQAKDDGGSCYGDSGGPAFWTEPDGSEVLVGITSWGDARCVANGVYYRVDIPETLSFLVSFGVE